jgi:NAD(P)-dependent dehydrogenase (short-subunit alcohol dehydrogenase family)
MKQADPSFRHLAIYICVENDFVGDRPMRRPAEPDEIARIITFLASDSAGRTTGISVTADGGSTRSLA